MSSKDNLGDRIKDYERAETNEKFMKGLPIIVRLDGRSFSKYTKDFNRPFDEGMSESMLNTTKYLLEKTNALFGYTQSDEINLLLYAENPKSDILFSGKKFKIISNFASMASVKFYSEIKKNKVNLPNSLPSFDCRVFQVPTKIEAWNAILWRVQDAIRNSIQQLGQANFSHRELQNKNQCQIQDMLVSEHKINWNDYPSKFKEGRFIRKITISRQITEKERDIMILNKFSPIPEMVTRSSVQELILPCNFNNIENRVKFLFNNEQPISW